MFTDRRKGLQTTERRLIAPEQILGVSSTAVVSNANVTSQHSIQLRIFDPFPNATIQPPGVYREGCTIRELARSRARPFPANLSGSGCDANAEPSQLALN
ncbi:hypothetical protein Zmor_020549 [Zophobas morio]|uniref:Uncharacterized protein n=1 Tax=Zophobas morio TaxID=2755281 RepID=A0AA38M9R9_9CUCU|nr:hypothetical protein Zmor_020549 [Zophobas morio]